MISKATISFIQSLKQKKFRQKYNKFILEGDKMILEGLANATISFDSIFCLPEKLPLFEEYNASVIAINAKELKKISALRTPPGILAIANISSPTNSEDLAIKKLALYLDDIKDPGNLGTIIRTGDWFGVEAIIASPETVDFYNPKVIQASMGSFSNMILVKDNLANVKKNHPELQIIGSTMDGDNIQNYVAKGPIGLVIGNESRGISESTRALCDLCLTIPKSPKAKVESLNAGIACAIFLGHLL